MSTVYGIEKQSAGEIHVYSEIGKGSTFKVFFPRLAAGAEDAPGQIRPSKSPEGSETLLVVEDDSSLRSLVARVLRNCGYTVYAAEGGDAALAIARNPTLLIDPVTPAAVIPGLNGR